MDTARFQYKCRLCNKVYSNTGTNKELAMMTLYHLVYGFDAPDISVGILPKMVECHSGCENGTGIADLIGYTLE